MQMVFIVPSTWYLKFHGLSFIFLKEISASSDYQFSKSRNIMKLLSDFIFACFCQILFQSFLIVLFSC